LGLVKRIKKSGVAVFARSSGFHPASIYLRIIV